MTDETPLRPSRATLILVEDLERAPGPFVTASGQLAMMTDNGPLPWSAFLWGPHPLEHLARPAVDQEPDPC